LSNSPDPEGGTLAIEDINKLIPAAKVSSSHLRNQAGMIKAQLTELAKLQYRSAKKALERETEHDGTEQMYK
jgi:predicted ATP-grasp superfamily ATP-dependent carboligase